MRFDMLAEERFKLLQDLVSTSTKEELIWINGYLSGLVSNGQTNGNGHAVPTLDKGQTSPTSVKKITLVFGTETGNSKRLATQLAAVAKKRGIVTKLTGLDQYRLADLPKEDYFFVVISTQGEGDPPITAKKFYDYIHENQLSLPNMRYSVLALGDTSYPQYCKTGEDVDAQLHKFGAKRLVPIQKCDVDYEEDAQKWFEEVITKLGEPGSKEQAAETRTIAKKSAGRKFYNGTLLTNINLNDKGSIKQTFHIEIGTDEPVEYETGDALAIFPVNKKIIVDQVIKLAGGDGNLVIETAKATGTAEELLTHKLNICHLLSSAVKKYAAIVKQEIPDVRMDLVDLLRIYPLKDASQFSEIIKILSPIAPRLYSISSSPAAQGNTEIHLTVSRNAFRVKDEQRFGLCSDFLGELPVNTVISFYIHKNRSFRLPPPDKDLIMIGPGTGVAPFRSFLYERDATGAKGRNW
ncbi:MAG TPA: flavodoxin domain-containing protein, partial [Chitinophagaceae bacterium]|nr:flavodoxin domain-containing protein [Chitinophagaceae bacterium]